MGNMGGHHAQLLFKQEKIQWVAMADPDKKKQEKASEEFGIKKIYNSAQEMIENEKLDAVFICTPTYLHASLTILALKKGCHVFCEKPMALDYAEAATMQQCAKDTGHILIIGQVLRFWPEYVYLKKMIDSQKLGALHALSLTRVGAVSIGYQRWFLDEKRGGTQIFDRHIHDTDAILWMLGMPDAVKSIGYQDNPDFNGGITHCFTQYLYPNNIAVSAEGSADMPDNFPFTASYRAVFDTACVEFNIRNTPTISVYPKTGEIIHPELPPSFECKSELNISSGNAYYAEHLYFFDCIEKGIQPTIVTPASAAETIRVVQAEMQSVRQQKKICLKE